MTLPRLLSSLFGALALASAAVPAVARDLPVPPDKAWQHAATGVILRAGLAGIPRTTLTDSTDSELDVAATFQDAPSDTKLSVFIFHPGGGSAAIWFDRARIAIESNKVWGGTTPLAPIATFAPPGSSTATGLRIAYTPAKNARGTALAVVPVGEWLVSLRLTSGLLDAAATQARLSEVIAAIGWPAEARTGAIATPIAACEHPIRFGKARQRAPDMMQALLGGTIASMAAKKGDTPDEKAKATVPPCRDGDGPPLASVYRSPDQTDTYLVALGDAGLVASVYKTFALGDKPAGYAVALYGLDGSTTTYPEFDARPGPAQIIEIVTRGQPLSRTSKDGKSITLSGDLAK